MNQLKMNRNALGLGVALLGCAGLAAGCAVETMEAEAERESQTITGGTLFASQAAPDTSVVKTSFGCTAIKIAAKRFLTAAHCVGGLAQGATIKVTNRLDGNLNLGSTVTVDQVHIHPTALNPNPGLWNFDVAMFDVAQNTSSIPSYNTIRKAYVTTGLSSTPTSYGCDNLDPSHNGQKQLDYFTTGIRNVSAMDAYTIWSTGSDPQVCPGDSGSPLFIHSGSAWEISGIVSGGGHHNGVPGSSFARIGAVTNWIAAPGYNGFHNGSRGFLINLGTNQCAGIDAARTGTGSIVRQFHCDGRDSQTTGSDHQYWEIVTTSTGYKIKNTKSGLCLIQGTNLTQGSCSSGTSFLFNPTTTDGKYGYFMAMGGIGDCIAPTGSAEGDRIVRSSCTTFDSKGSWIFSR